MPASEALALSGADWAAVLGDLIVPMVGHLAVAVNAQSAALHGAERSLKLAVGLMTKTLLQNLTKLPCQPGFAKLWDRILQVRAAPRTSAGAHGFIFRIGYCWYCAADVCCGGNAGGNCSMVHGLLAKLYWEFRMSLLLFMLIYTYFYH